MATRSFGKLWFNSLRVLLIGAILGLVVLTIVYGSEEDTNGPISSLQDFEKEIADKALVGYDALMKDPRFRQINTPKHESLWQELKSQNRRPVLVAVAFYCIRHNRPERAFAVAAESLLERPEDISMAFYTDMLAEIEKATPSDEVLASLVPCPD